MDPISLASKRRRSRSMSALLRAVDISVNVSCSPEPLTSSYPKPLTGPPDCPQRTASNLLAGKFFFTYLRKASKESPSVMLTSEVFPPSPRYISFVPLTIHLSILDSSNSLSAVEMLWKSLVPPVSMITFISSVLRFAESMVTRLFAARLDLVSREEPIIYTRTVSFFLSKGSVTVPLFVDVALSFFLAEVSDAASVSFSVSAAVSVSATVSFIVSVGFSASTAFFVS